MKNVFLIATFIIANAMPVAAQLKVKSTGSTNIGVNSQGLHYGLAVGADPDTGFNTDALGIYSKVSTWRYGGVAVYGDAFYGDEPSATGTGMGVCGIAGNRGHGNYGLEGILKGTKAGAAIYGNVANFQSTTEQQYAGLFNGEVKVNGTVRATSVVTTSDMRLKENIAPLNEDSEKSTLENVLDMNVVEYTLKIPPMTISGASQTEGKDAEIVNSNIVGSDKKHIGLLAQELQKIYPELVEEGQDGYLGINYIELVPVLIRAIQEQQKQIKELQEELGLDVEKGLVKRSPSAEHTTANIKSSIPSKESTLYQNTPNPFREQTVIRFQIASKAKKATLCIFDLQGKLIKKYNLSIADTEKTISNYELREGIYLYTLLVDDMEVATKRMILTK